MDGEPAKRAISPGGTVELLSLGGIPGFAAGFTRGALTEPTVGPDAAARALAVGLGAPDAEVVRLKQVHGTHVLTFEEPPRQRRNVLLGEGDGLLTRQFEVLLAVASADCVPVVLADPGTGWIAAVHAGWRGTAARVLDAAIDALATRGVRPEDLVAAFGPSVSIERYEVGPEVVAALRDAYGAEITAGAVREGRRDRAFVDIAAFNLAALRARGVRPGRIASSLLCTAATSDLPSFRRVGKRAGRILTGIVRAIR